MAGSVFKRNESGDTNVPDPTANPTPEKYASVATTALGKYKILSKSKRRPPTPP
jgi:hypothetical protein